MREMTRQNDSVGRHLAGLIDRLNNDWSLKRGRRRKHIAPNVKFAVVLKHMAERVDKHTDKDKLSTDRPNQNFVWLAAHFEDAVLIGHRILL